MFSNLKLSGRITAVIGFLCIVLLAVGAAGMYGMRTSNARLKTVYEDRTIALGQLARIDALTLESLHQVQRVLSLDPRLTDGQPQEQQIAAQLAHVKTNVAEIESTWKSYMATYLTPEEAKLAATFAAVKQRFLAEGLEPALAMLSQVKFREAANHVNSKAEPIFDELNKANDALVRLQIDVAKQEYDQGVLDYDRLLAGGSVLVATCMLLAAGLGWALIRAIALPMRAAVAAARKVAAGDLTVALDTHRRDEIGELLEAMQQMVGKLNGVIGQIRTSTELVGSASQQIAAGNVDLSQRTEEQASSLEETASSMEELTSTVKQNADNARQANQLAASASEVAAKGGAVVDEVVSTMGAISASSKKIADIISVIDGIAFQTNILALNAAVEAARAGEQGRGFAVVASEVRSLAQKSAGAAKEIKDLITDSVGKVDSGTKLVADAGNTMAEVVASVKRVTDIMAEITAASLEQSSGIEQVNQAIVQMDQVTQQNAALVEESAAAAASMADQARELAGAVAVFKIAGGATAAATRRAPATPDTSVPALQATETAATEGGWNGVERRGPNRATNVTRPKFNSKARPAKSTESVAVDVRRTGTDDSWAEF